MREIDFAYVPASPAVLALINLSLSDFVNLFLMNFLAFDRADPPLGVDIS